MARVSENDGLGSAATRLRLGMTTLLLDTCVSYEKLLRYST